MKRFEGRVAIVSGAAQGIGRAIALRLGKEGATVAVVDINKAGAGKAAKAIGGNAFAVGCDIGDPDAVAKLRKAVVKTAGKLDVLVNAGAIVPFVPWDELDFEEWRRVMRVNLDGVFFTFQTAARHMVERGKGGSLVAMASTAAIEGAARSSHYGASKGGVCAMVRALAVELARYKITVNSILPGWIETEMTANAFGNPKFAGNVMPRIPERRWGVGADFGPIAVYLASSASGYTTGRDFVIDGGYTLF